jgi:hypothetical protein
MLNNARHNINSSILAEIKKFYYYYQLHNPLPQRFKFSIKDNSHFNYKIVINIVQIGTKDALHIIDTDTSFQAATFLKLMSAQDT